MGWGCTVTQTDNTIILPQHGVDYEMPAAEYHKLPLCSKHALDLIWEWSPMHLKWHRENPPEPTDAMVFGSALHTAVLEPEKFDDEFIVSGQCESTKKSGERCTNQGTKYVRGGWLCGVHSKGIDGESNGKLAISAKQKESIDNIVRAVSFNRAATELLKAEGKNEVSAFFKHPETGTECKLRTDGIRPGWEAAFDIKTIENASPREFERALAQWRYDAQAAFYQDGLAQVGINIKHFAFIVVEKSAPYGIATYRLMDEAIQAGRECYLADLRIYAECERSGFWPGYDSEFQDITLPKWRMRQIANGQI